ncbi:MAG TPA: VOC family protein [Acidimicrobiales bacterium]|nr:VOC family protein [Acidimicrobiales bacterium]
MTDSRTKPRPPRFNHVAMSMPAGSLDAAGRKAIVDFYGQVFGWEELPTLTEDGRRLVLQAYRYDQFVFLIADDEPMSCPRMDHFGMSVRGEDELDELLARCKAYAESDDRVDIIDKQVEDHDVLKVKSFYVRYLLPMMIEVQLFELSPS